MGIISTTNNEYYIKRLEKNLYNDFKYFYLEKLFGLINIVDGK